MTSTLDFDKICADLKQLLPEVLADEKETWPEPIFYSRSHFHGDEEKKYYPCLTKADGWEKLENSRFITLKYPLLVRAPNQDNSKVLKYLKQHYPNIHHNVGVTIGNVGSDLISNSIRIDWLDKPYHGYFNKEKWEMEKEEIDLEYKQLVSFLNLKRQQQPHEPVSTELFDLFAQNYLSNLAHTRWLYNDYMMYKQHVANQKKRKRDNYKKNLKIRNRLDNFFGDDAFQPIQKRNDSDDSDNSD